jgi:glucose/arabinose dehydrogenase
VHRREQARPRRISTLTAALAATVLASCSNPSTTKGPTPSTSISPAPTISSSADSTPPTNIRAVRVATLDQPLGMAVRPGDVALYIVGKRGMVWALGDGRVDPEPVLDLTGKVSRGSEQGLLGLAFSPDGAYAYVNYTDVNGETKVVEYAWRDGRADPTSRRLIFFVHQPFPNHNGGDLVFGPDGDLYIGMGDGGSDYSRGDPWGDPDRNGQNLGVVLGKMLRIEPRMPDGSLPPEGAAYAVPPDNPFVARSGARPEIWAYGLRNPWRYSFDRDAGDLWIGDVGAGQREEVDVQEAGSPGGQNYGWNTLEGTVAYRSPPPDAVPPVYEYNHRGGGCAITGGFVYRGSALASLRGWYVFGDYCSGTIEALPVTGSLGARVYAISGDEVRRLSSFGEDQQGELYALSLAGGVYQLRP